MRVRFPFWAVRIRHHTVRPDPLRLPDAFATFPSTTHAVRGRPSVELTQLGKAQTGCQCWKQPSTSPPQMRVPTVVEPTHVRSPFDLASPTRESPYPETTGDG